MDKLTIESPFTLWIVGQIAAVMIGISVGFKYGLPAGIAFVYLLWVLIDIRLALSR